MNVTITFQKGNSQRVHQAHNRRDKSVMEKEGYQPDDLGTESKKVKSGKGYKTEHIYPAGAIRPDGRVANYDVVKDENIAAAYKRLFGDALAEYNAKQKRKDRKIRSYYAHIEKDAKRQTAYEMILGVYGDFKELPTDTRKAIMDEYLAEWQERNPQLELVGVYWHDDEDGQPHYHIDYIPWADGYKTGLYKQSAMNKALEQMGVVKEKGDANIQDSWEKRERLYIEQLCSERGYTVVHEPTKREHLEKANYILIQQNKEQQQIIQAQQQTIEELREERIEASYKANKGIFKKKDEEPTLTILTSEYERLVANDKRKEELDKREKAIKDKERDIQVTYRATQDGWNEYVNKNRQYQIDTRAELEKEFEDKYKDILNKNQRQLAADQKYREKEWKTIEHTIRHSNLSRYDQDSLLESLMEALRELLERVFER